MKTPLKKIKESALSRGLALAKVGVSAGAKAARHAVSTVFSNEEEKAQKLRELWASQAQSLANELGQLKGSVMKVGQMLSMYGEHFLPEEANRFLKSLQNQAPPLEWSEIEKVLIRQLGREKLQELEIEKESYASASMGQVHRAKLKSTGTEVVLKIQYPGVDRAIDGDLKAMKSILALSKWIPQDSGTQAGYEELFKEVRQMLHREVDYQQEHESMEEFRGFLKGDARFRIPAVYAEYSRNRVLTTEFTPGHAIDSDEVRNLSQERRNHLAMAGIDLFFKEIFEFRTMQTDPHFGNYRAHLDEKNGDALILFDFGAIRKFPLSFMKPYYRFLYGAYSKNPSLVMESGRELGFLREEDSSAMKEGFAELCFLLTEPMRGVYDYGSSDLPKRASTLASQVAFSFKLRPPPREVVFLDRKMGGVFILLKVLGAKIHAGPLLDHYFEQLKSQNLL